jgi:thioredoxin-related protein
MPNFFEAEKIMWKYFDFILVNSNSNLWLFEKFRVMWTPTIIILDWEKIVFNQSWVPNWWELKVFMMNLAWITQEDLEKDKQEKKKKWFFGLF